MIVTDGKPTIAWAGMSAKDKDSRRRQLARRRAAKAAAIKAAMRQRLELREEIQRWVNARNTHAA